MQHDFGNAAREENANGWMMGRSVGQDVDNARHLAIDFDPVANLGPWETCGVRDGRNVQQQVR